MKKRLIEIFWANKFEIELVVNKRRKIIKISSKGVDTSTREILFKMGPFNNATNNIGEFLALVHGIAVLEKRIKNHQIVLLIHPIKI